MYVTSHKTEEICYVQKAAEPRRKDFIYQLDTYCFNGGDCRHGYCVYVHSEFA